MKLFDLFDRKCRQCGKHFESRKEYSYRKTVKKGRYIYFCSYKCMRLYEKARMEKKVKYSEIEQSVYKALAAGMTPKETADALGLSMPTVYKYQHKMMEAAGIVK